jgi:tetratricopeptide (TPR) repeat protein
LPHPHIGVLLFPVERARHLVFCVGWQRCEQALEGLRLDSYAFLCHLDLGELYRATGSTADAIKELEWVALVFPEADPKTYLSLAVANQTAGKHDAAVSALEKGGRLFR